jgi:hypothetical protein
MEAQRKALDRVAPRVLWLEAHSTCCGIPSTGIRIHSHVFMVRLPSNFLKCAYSAHNNTHHHRGF